MTGAPEADDASGTPHDGTDVPKDDAFSRLGEEERRVMLKWVGENLTDVRGIASGKRVQQWILWLSLVIGLVVYVAGYALRASFTSEPLAFRRPALALGMRYGPVRRGRFLKIIPEMSGGSTAGLDASRGTAAGAAARLIQGSSTDEHHLERHLRWKRMLRLRRVKVEQRDQGLRRRRHYRRADNPSSRHEASSGSTASRSAGAIRPV